MDLSRKWYDLLQDDGLLEKACDTGLRHQTPRAKPEDYLKAWLKISRDFGYATHDDSWGEFEKEFAIIIRRLVRAEAKLAELEEAKRRAALQGI